MTADAVVRMPDALHGLGQAHNLRRRPKMFQSHELVVAGTAPIPGLSPQVFKTLGVKLNGFAKIGTPDLADGAVKRLCLLQDLIKFFIGEIQAGHGLVVNHLQRRAGFQIQQPRFLRTDGNTRVHDQRRLASDGTFPQQVEDGFDSKGLNLHTSILPHLGLVWQRGVISFATTNRAVFWFSFSKKILFFFWVLLTAYTYIE